MSNKADPKTGERPNSITSNDILAANLDGLHRLSVILAENVTEARTALMNGSRNEAIGCLLGQEKNIEAMQSLYNAIIFLHRQLPLDAKNEK